MPILVKQDHYHWVSMIQTGSDEPPVQAIETRVVSARSNSYGAGKLSSDSHHRKHLVSADSHRLKQSFEG